MAHVADFMVDANTNVGMNNYIARELSPSSGHDTVRSQVYNFEIPILI